MKFWMGEVFHSRIMCTSGYILKQTKAKADAASNFDKSANPIHVAKLLNTVGPIIDMGILSSTWQILAHIVNINMPPTGPR